MSFDRVTGLYYYRLEREKNGQMMIDPQPRISQELLEQYDPRIHHPPAIPGEPWNQELATLLSLELQHASNGSRCLLAPTDKATQLIFSFARVRSGRECFGGRQPNCRTAQRRLAFVRIQRAGTWSGDGHLLVLDFEDPDKTIEMDGEEALEAKLEPLESQAAELLSDFEGW